MTPPDLQGFLRGPRRCLSATSGALLAVAALAAVPAAAQTTIVAEQFGNGWTPGTTWSLQGSATPVIAQEAGQTPEYALRLTPAGTQYQRTAVVYSEAQPASGGLDITFRISQWKPSGLVGEGMSFFLRKGSEASNALGGTGGALGYATFPSANQDGLPGGLVGVGFDSIGEYTRKPFIGGADCPDTSGPNPNAISIRGPQGAGLRDGYCLLADDATSGLWVTSGIDFTTGSTTRSTGARSIRITVDPSTAVSPKIKVYYGSSGSGTTGASPVFTTAVPAALLSEPTFKFGIVGATGFETSNTELWGLEVKSLQTLPGVSITTTSLPSGTVGTAYTATSIATTDGVAPLSFAVTAGSLPAGLSLNATTGVVSGTPLSGGTSTFTVTATDSRTPTASADSRAYTIAVAAIAPGAPSIGSASPPVAQATDVSFTAPSSDGGATISSYEATCVSSTGGVTRSASGSTSPISVPGLTRGATYTCTVTATNAAGTSPASSPTSAFSVPLLGAPGAPTDVVAGAGDGSATVTWEAPADDGGSAITSYVVTAEPGGRSCTWTSGPLQCTVDGLTPGVAYTFSVQAINAVGTGLASRASAAVSPDGPASTPPAPTPPAPSNATSTLRPTVLTSRTRLTAGQALRVGIRARNTGAASASNATLCLVVPSNFSIVRQNGALRSGRTLCFRVGDIAAGRQATKVVTLRAVSARTVTRRITGIAQSASADPTRVATRSAAIRISPRTARARVTG